MKKWVGILTAACALALPAMADDAVRCEYYTAANSDASTLDITSYASSGQIADFRNGDVTHLVYHGALNPTAKSSMDSALLAGGDGDPQAPDSTGGDDPCSSTSNCEASLAKSCVSQATAEHRAWPSLAACNVGTTWSTGDGTNAHPVSCGCTCSLVGTSMSTATSVQCWPWHCAHGGPNCS